jgi:hypothetical protein
MIAGGERIGQLAAELMEAIEAEELPEGLSNARVGVVGVVVEIEADDENNPHGSVQIKYRCTDTRGWVQAGLFLAASDSSRDWFEDIRRD